jgi:DNA-binding response OmpR family regulator
MGDVSAEAGGVGRAAVARRVLVIDDEPGIRRVLRGFLEADGLEVVEAATGEQGLAELRRRRADLVLLDVMLPDLDGLEVLRRIRATSQVGVILLTARAEEVDTLVGLAVGADDYVTKPFSPRAVVARVKAVLRRARADESDSERLEFDGLTVDLAAREVRLGTGSVSPSALEFDLLAALAGSPGRVFSRRQLLERVWGDDFYCDERVVDVHIRSLRRLLADDVAAPRYIGTVRGVGYKFVRRPA